MSDDADPVAWNPLEREYVKLREEIQEAIRNQVRILGYGGTALSVLLGAGLVRESVLVVTSLPVLAFFFLVLWNVEQTRMMRAGDYLYGVEQQLKRADGEHTMLWESWLRDRSETGPEWRSLPGVAPAVPAADAYDIHYVAQFLVVGVFVLMILAGAAAVWVWQPAGGGVSFGLGAKVGLTVLYAAFVVVAVYLVHGTVRHDADDAVREFRDLPDDG